MSVIPRGKKIYIVRLERNVEVMTVITQIFSVAQSFMWFFFSVNPLRVSPVCSCFVLVDRMLQIFLRRETFRSVITQIFSVAQSFMWFFFSVNPLRVSPVCSCFVLVDRMLQIFLRRETFEGKFFPAIGTFFRHVVDEHPHYFLRLRAWPLLRI